MISLALLGYNISHSLSPKIYKNLLGNINYELLDFKDAPHINTLKKYNGISITSPHKKVYLDEIEMLCPEVLDAINCLLPIDNKVLATNTDYVALNVLFNDYFKKIKKKRVIILGNGAMGQLVSTYCKNSNIDYIVAARQTHGKLEYIDLKNIFQSEAIIINCCSRKFIFKGNIPSNSFFWDLNYKYEPHQYLKNKCEFKDGEEFLHIQAQESIKFWQL